MQVEVIIETLLHDGDMQAPGTILELERESAQQLLDVGAVRPAPAKSGAAAADKPSKKQAAGK